MKKTGKILGECAEHTNDINDKEIIESNILIKSEKIESRSSLNEVPLSHW